MRGTASNRDAIGAVVTVEADGRRQVRRSEAGSSYASQHDDRLHFGFGDAERVDRLEVRWPDGSVQAVAVDAVDRELVIEQQG